MAIWVGSLGRAQLGRYPLSARQLCPRAGLALGWGSMATRLTVCLSAPSRQASACPHPEVEGFQEKQVSEHPCRSTLQGFACVMFTNAPMAKAISMGYADLKGGESDSTF